VQRIIAAPAKECGGATAQLFSSLEHRCADKRPQALTGRADQILPRQGHQLLDAHEINGWAYLAPALRRLPLSFP